jgi:hypothetical protein
MTLIVEQGPDILANSPLRPSAIKMSQKSKRYTIERIKVDKQSNKLLFSV